MTRREKNLKKNQRRKRHLEEREVMVQEELERFREIVKQDPFSEGLEFLVDFTDEVTGKKFTRRFTV